MSVFSLFKEQVEQADEKKKLFSQKVMILES